MLPGSQKHISTRKISHQKCIENNFRSGKSRILKNLACFRTSLRQAIELIFEDRKADILRGLPDDAIQDTVMSMKNKAMRKKNKENFILSTGDG